MAKKIQMMSHDKEWQVVNGVEVLVPVEQFDIDPVTDSSCVKIEGFRTLEETLNEKNMFTPEVNTTKVMDRVGGEYHQNVVDGAYEEAVLYGNTQVNLVEDDTSTSTPIPQSFTSFNNGLQKELALGNNTVAPMLKGVTLINRALTNSVSLASGEKFYIHNLKGNTVHTVSFKFTTKNTNAGVVIESCTGETYLENSMYKTGLGDNVIFTVTTHTNADSIAIVNNATYGGETIQLDDIMVIEGDQTLMNLTFFKGMRSVELVKPLTNLFTDDIYSFEAGATATGNSGNFVVTSKSSATWTAISFKMSMLKNNTKYLVMWDSLTATQTSTLNTEELLAVYYVDANVKAIGTINNNSLCPTKRSLIFDTKNYNMNQVWLKIHATLTNTETGTTTVKGLRIFEWDDATSRALDLQGIGYFSGTKNVSIPNFKTNSKNLYPYGDVNFTASYVGWCDAKGNAYMYGDIAQKSQSRFLLRKGSYILSYVGATNVSAIAFAKDNGDVLSSPMTLTQDTYVTLVVKTTQANVVTTVTNIQIERGDTATSYVSYDTRQYKPDNQEVVVLRSLPNGVCDTFNLQTGEYVQNIGEITINGNGAVNNIIDGAYARIIVPSNKSTSVMSSVIGFYCSGALALKNNGASSNNYGIYENPANFVLFDKTVTSSEEFATKYNDVTIQYQLAEPVIKQIPTVNNIYNASSKVDFKESKNANFSCFGNPTYLEVGSLSPINPIVEPITNLPYDVRLKANTTYTVKLDRENSNALTVDLGGTTYNIGANDTQCSIKTPTGFLSHEQIKLSGNGTIGQVMVIEGNVLDKELPYFNGMCNVKMPIARNCGRNLFDGELYVNIGINNNGTTSATIPGTSPTQDWVTTKNYIPVKKGEIISIDIDADDSDITSNRRYVYVYKYDTQKRQLINNRYDLGVNTKTFTITHNGYIRCTIRTHNVHNITITKENTPSSVQYRGNDIYIIDGQINLTSDLFEQGGFTTANGQYTDYEEMKYDASIRIRSKTLLRVKPNTTYRVMTPPSRLVYNVYEWDENKRKLEISHMNNDTELVFTTSSDTHYIHFLFSKYSDNPITVSEFDWSFFQLLELDSTVQLRSLPNGVKDELNLLTGEYIQRVGEVVLDGSDDELWYDFLIEPSGLGRMLLTLPSSINSSIICDKIRVVGYGGSWNNTYECCSIVSGYQNFILYLTNVVSESEFRNKLQTNPVTVQYELAEPIISYPRIVSNTQEREVGIKLPNGVCDTYNPSTGVTVKRVGKVVLDGSEKYVRDGSSTKPTDLERFSTPIGDMVSSPYNTGNFVVETSGYNIVNNDKTSPRKLPNVWNYYQANIYLDFATTAFGMTTGDSVDTKISKLKTYLASNPITIYYELANPIVTTDIVLPNDVHDEYNPITGLYTKKVEYIELDGGETNLNYRVHSNGYLLVDINGIKMTSLQTQPTNNILSNISVRSTDDIYNNTNITTTSVALHHQAKSLMVRVVDSSTTVTTANEYRQYLSKNPIKIWYELATPQKIQLTPYFGLPMPYAYKDGHLIMDSAYNGVSLPPEFKYKLVANRTGQINQNNIKLQNHTSRLSNLEAMLVEATLQSMYEREMMAFNLEMANINLINLEE